METESQSDDIWDKLEASINQMVGWHEATGWHVERAVADSAIARLQHCRAQGYPAPRLLPESEGDLTLVWRDQGWVIYQCFEKGGETYYDLHYRPTPVPGTPVLSEAEQKLIAALEWFIENDETNRGGEWEKINEYWITGLEAGWKAIADAKGLPYVPEDHNTELPTKFTIHV